MNLTPDKKALTQPIGEAPTLIDNVQQDGTNPAFNLGGLSNSSGMNQVGTGNYLPLRGINQTTPQTGVLQAPGTGQTLTLPGYQSQNPTDNNPMSFLQSSGIIHSPNPANLWQPYGTHQTINNPNFLQSPGMNQTLNQASVLQSPGMNQTFSQADSVQLYGMYQNINPMGYQQQFEMNPNLGPMGYEQFQMNPNHVHDGAPTRLSDGFTAFDSTPSCNNYFPTQSPTVSGSPTSFNINQLMSPNMKGTMNQGMNTHVAPYQQFHLPVVNGLHNSPIGSGMSMTTGMTFSPETHLPAANGLPNFTNMDMNMNSQHLPVFSGLHNTSTRNGMNMNVNLPQQPRYPVITYLQNPSIGNGILQQPQSQLPRIPSIEQASHRAPKTRNQILGPQHPGPTRIKKTLSSNTASSLGNCLNRYYINCSNTSNMTSAAPSITPKLRAALEVTLADRTKAVAQTVVPKSSNGSQKNPQSSREPSEQKGKRKAEQGQHTALPAPAVRQSTQLAPQPPAAMRFQQPAQQAAQDAVGKTVQQPTRKPSRRRAQKPLQRPLTVPSVQESARDTIQDPIQQQPAQRPVKEPDEQKVQQAVEQQQPVQDLVQQPVQQPVEDSAKQQLIQQTGTQERNPPVISLDDLRIFLSDRHWEFWHRVNILKLHELAKTTGSDAHICQAWLRRLSDRWFSGDYSRVYELGGFLYEIRMDLYGSFKEAKAIELREYAGLLDRVRPKCCSSLDYTQALAAAKARAEGKYQPWFDKLEKAQAASDVEIGRLDGTEWWQLARLVKNMDEWVKGLIAKDEADGTDESKK
ncbi:hypothetical protein GGI35DRAFT_471208 [Trichoderma velutinum]